jgi:hypothetical protein
MDPDKYNRTVAEVLFNTPEGEQWVQEEMLRGGFAYRYKQFSSNCHNRDRFDTAVAIGRSQQRGVWKLQAAVSVLGITANLMVKLLWCPIQQFVVGWVSAQDSGIILFSYGNNFVSTFITWLSGYFFKLQIKKLKRLNKLRNFIIFH